ncbi:MAG: SGNH/GDSL hydrolase family protein [Planctomycetaceae bacterium]
MIGGTFIEREQRESYIETALTAYYPDRHITFRNLGWSGDTIRAESRGIFDPPEVGYQRLMEQVAERKPTVVMLFYGNNESFAGEKGLPQFEQDYRKLLDDLSTAAGNPVFVLVSPHSHVENAQSLPDPEVNNRNLKLYSKSIHRIADEYQAKFVDLYSQLSANIDVKCENGIHLSTEGYRWIAAPFREFLLGSDTDRDTTDDRYFVWHVKLNADGKVLSAVTTNKTIVENVEPLANGLRFDSLYGRLRMSLPREGFGSHVVEVTGLPIGEYSLHIDGTEIHTFFDDKEKNKNCWFYSGPEFDQTEKLRQAIIEKNRLYFYRWRPQNVTYLFGFRKHEQGNNAVEVPQFDPLIEELEAKIAELRKPVKHRYEILRDENNE